MSDKLLISTSTIGLDISTSIIGVCGLDIDNEITILDYIDLRKIPDFWDKCRAVENYLKTLPTQMIQSIKIEEPLKRFASASSASTLITLQRFNAVVSYQCLKYFGINPTYINVSTARKNLGIKIQSKTKCGKSAKEQTWEYVTTNILQDYASTMTLKRGQTEVNFNSVAEYYKDIIDSYVIALA